MYIKRITGVENDFTKEENKKLIEAKKDIEAFLKQRKAEINQENINQKPQLQIQDLLDCF